MRCECQECRLVKPEVYFCDNKCPECGGHAKPIGPFYVNTYLVNRHYGGPQEGGWWYNSGEPMDSRLCDTYKEMLKVKGEMEAKCEEENEDRRPLHSVLSNGRVMVVLEDHFAEEWPSGRPAYE